jgi:hypothetical protein
VPRYRNITDVELWVPIIDKVVQPDEVVDFPDHPADDPNPAPVYPETVWAAVAPLSAPRPNLTGKDL